MARNRNRRQAQTARLTRRTFQPLEHTVSLPPEPFRSQPRSRLAYSTSPVRSPLIRTVLVEPEVLQPRPRRGQMASPAVQSRATGRSSDRRIRSPFLNATMVTPELTERAILCAKRSIRREVLFATKQTGKGAKSPKPFRSKVRC